MQPIYTVFKREFMGYFQSPVAYVFLIIFLLASVGFTWFLGGFFDTNNASLTRFFVFQPWIFLFLIPAVGMRLWAEERRSGTWELLLTLPLSATQAVFGKFLAGWAFLSLAIVLSFTMPLTVAYLGDPDWGPIFSGYLGSILMAGAYLSICSLTSSLTQNQVISFVISAFCCLILALLGWDVLNDLMIAAGFSTWLVDAFANFSFITHFEPMTRGLVTVPDVVFFLSLVVFCLLVNVLVIER